MKYFKDSEFACPCCGANEMDKTFVERLDLARDIAGVPFVITSGFRCEKHNSEVGGKKDSAHLKGLAVDIKCATSHDRNRMIRAFALMGFKRFGIGKTFIHVDEDPDLPQEVTWLYA